LYGHALNDSSQVAGKYRGAIRRGLEFTCLDSAVGPVLECPQGDLAKLGHVPDFILAAA